MTNIEKQADEILVLQSIFDKKFRLLDENQYEILIEFDLSLPFTLRLDHQISIIQYLPPLSLIIHYHNEYPNAYPPSFILSCFYFFKIDLKKLCEKLDNYSFVKGEVCVYNWIELIKQEISHEFILRNNVEEYENDPRALNAYSSENAQNIFQNLIDYDHERQKELFRNQLQTCLICTDIIPGLDCIRLYRCGHFYCRSCLDNYVRMTIDNGKFGEKLHCPQNECQQPLLPTEIKQIVQNEELYERYERLTLQHGLELMNDIVWCPRCQLPVLSGIGNDNLVICDRCRYTFCKKCNEIFHSQAMCPKDYFIEQLKLKKQKELERIEYERRLALAELAKINEKKQLLHEQKIAKQQYRQIVINLSEQDALLRELLTAEQIQSQDIQYCPQCHAPIEKNGGCSHMHCTRCNTDFTWKAKDAPSEPTVSSLLANKEDLESVKEKLNQASTIVGKVIPETRDPTDETPVDEEKKDLKIRINNKSVIGSAILNRVKTCPNKACKKLNVKTTQDNWMVCSACMRQYCFQCGSGVNGLHHFEKKCLRHTPI